MLTEFYSIFEKVAHPLLNILIRNRISFTIDAIIYILNIPLQRHIGKYVEIGICALKYDLLLANIICVMSTIIIHFLNAFHDTGNSADDISSIWSAMSLVSNCASGLHLRLQTLAKAIRVPDQYHSVFID